jgi:5' nucleotidase, deoxy (Pyrimidine), cytosolic type C protein (NT5C)
MRYRTEPLTVGAELTDRGRSYRVERIEPPPNPSAINYGIPYRDLYFTGRRLRLEQTSTSRTPPHNVLALREVADTIVFTNSTNRDLEGPHADTWQEVEALVLERKARLGGGAVGQGRGRSLIAKLATVKTERPDETAPTGAT